MGGQKGHTTKTLAAVRLGLMLSNGLSLGEIKALDLEYGEALCNYFQFKEAQKDKRWEALFNMLKMMAGVR